MEDKHVDWEKVRELAIKKFKKEYYTHYDAVGKETGPKQVTGLKKDKFAATCVDRYIEYLRDKNSEWNWIANHVSDQVISEVIVELSSGKYDYLRVLSNADKNRGLTYVEDKIPLDILYVDKEKILDRSEEMTPCCKVYGDSSLYLYYPEMQKRYIETVIMSHHDNISVFDALIQTNDNICSYFLSEMSLSYSVNYGMGCYIRVNQYIKLTYLLLGESVYYTCFKMQCCDNVRRREKMSKIMDNAENSILLLRETKRVQKLFNEYNTGSYSMPNFERKVGGGIVSPVFIVFPSMLALKRLFEEENLIEDILEEEIRENHSIFEDTPDLLHAVRTDDMRGSEIIREVLGKNHGSTEDYERIGIVADFIKKWGKDYGTFGHEDSMGLYQIIYRECYLSKAKSSRKSDGVTAATIMRKYMNGDNINKREEVFMEKKFKRGEFVLFGCVDDYSTYNEIMRFYREILLEIYEIADCKVAFELLHKINNYNLSVLKEIACEYAK